MLSMPLSATTHFDTHAHQPKIFTLNPKPSNPNPNLNVKLNPNPHLSPNPSPSPYPNPNPLQPTELDILQRESKRKNPFLYTPLHNTELDILQVLINPNSNLTS